MRLGNPLKIASVIAIGAGLVTYARYRREMSQRIEEIEIGGALAHTVAGAIEYAEAGEGEPC